MKLVLILVSIGLLAYGSISRNLVMNLLGAGVFLVSLVVDLVKNIIGIKIALKKMRAGEPDSTPQESSREKLTNALQGVVTFAGLAGMGIGQITEDEDVWSWPGILIWVGAILFYFNNGVVVREMTGIPLRMGYGGWYVARRKGSRSLHSKSYNKYVRRR